MTGRVATFVLAVGAIAIAAVLAQRVLGARANAARREVATVVQGLTAVDTARATHGLERSRAQRAGVAEMRSMLTALVSAESALTADSGFPRAQPPREYWSRPMGNNIGPYIQIAFDGWYAWTRNTHADVWCAVAVGPDTQWFDNAASGKPVCFGASVPTPDFARIGNEDQRRYLRATGQARP